MKNKIALTLVSLFVMGIVYTSCQSPLDNQEGSDKTVVTVEVQGGGSRGLFDDTAVDSVSIVIQNADLVQVGAGSLLKDEDNSRWHAQISISETGLLKFYMQAKNTSEEVLYDGYIESLISGNDSVTIIARPWGTDYTSATIGTLKYVPAGRFQRDATATNISEITQPYRMSQHEITRAQFLAVMGTDPSDTTISSGTSDPVQLASWYHAIAFANKLSLAEGLTPVYSVSGITDWEGLDFSSIPTYADSNWDAATATWEANGYRLPTEMEWMWAAMGATADGQGGGTNTTGYSKAFAGSTGSNSINDYIWYISNSGSKTNPVGTKLPNELGLYDMSGNVWELSWDWNGSYPSGTLTDYRGVTSSSHRAARGGSWFDFAAFCAVAVKSGNYPNYQYNNFGFRLVRP